MSGIPDNLSSDEWLTLAEVARRLGIHERQARRYANRLDEADRTVSGQKPLRVRVSAIQALRDRTPQTTVRLETGPDRTEKRPDTPDSVRPEEALTRRQAEMLYLQRLEALETQHQAAMQGKEEVIAEKDARIREQAERIHELQEQIADARRLRDEALQAALRPWWKRFFG